MWKRLIGVFCAFCLAFTLLYLRLGAVAADPFYVEAGQRQSSYTLEIPLERGMIYDCNLQPLVNRSSRQVAAILVTQENAETVAEITGLSRAEVARRLQEGKPFLHEVSVTGSEDENIRVFSAANRYEEPQTAQHLIGYLSGGEGVAGLEKSYQDLLQAGGATARVTYTLDAVGRAIPGTAPRVEIDRGTGEGLVLSIDARIQQLCERAGESLGRGAVVVMECATGRLRAVCSFPAYSTRTLEQDMESADAPMINRAFTALSVGSAFKVAVAAAALESGVSPLREYDCTGACRLGDTVIHCHDRAGHGVLRMESALVESCNPYFITLGLSLEPEALLRTARGLSFGQGYELAPGLRTAAGLLPEDTSAGAVANLGFGQGDLLATPVQLAQMMSAAACGGVTPTPSLVEGVAGRQGNWKTVEPVPAGTRAFSPATAYKLQSFLIACVEAEGQNARPRGTTAGGKTGTAQTGVYRDGEEQVNGWFVGFTPAAGAEYAVAVVAEDAESGNRTAAPVFAEIAQGLARLSGAENLG